MVRRIVINAIPQKLFSISFCYMYKSRNCYSYLSVSQQIVDSLTKPTFTKEAVFLRPMSDESMNGQMSVGLGVLSETFYETAFCWLTIK